MRLATCSVIDLSQMGTESAEVVTAFLVFVLRSFRVALSTGFSGSESRSRLSSPAPILSLLGRPNSPFGLLWEVMSRLVDFPPASREIRLWHHLRGARCRGDQQR